MSYKGLPEHLVRRVMPTAVQKYALATGWVRIPGIRGEIAVYRRPDSEMAEIVVPQDTEFGDYERRMAEAISWLAEFERRAPIEILSDLLHPSADVLRFRRDDADTSDGTIPFGEGLRLLSGSRKALLATACSVIQPQGFHPRLSRAEAEAFVNACRLGQTERGSFIATLICPLDAGSPEAAEQQGSLFPEAEPEPFARQVTMSLLRSVSQIVEAIGEDQPRRLVEPTENDVVISANLCEALLEMRPSGEQSGLSIGVTWARTAPPRSPVVATVRLRADHFPSIEETARLLRPKAEPKRDFFVGKVDALNGEPGSDGRMQGQVTLVLQADEELLKARLDLPPEDYATACDAHTEDQYVRVSGVLHRGGRIHHIHDYREFRVVGSGE